MCQNQPVKKKVRMGMTFGGFDLLHFGHINLLKQAKDQCHHLIVGLSTYYYILNNKHHEPILSYEDRKYLLIQSGYVDLVEPQSNTHSKEKLINIYKPDILFVGDDWTPDTYKGAGLCETIYLSHTKGVSTTWYRERLNL